MLRKLLGTVVLDFAVPARRSPSRVQCPSIGLRSAGCPVRGIAAACRSDDGGHLCRLRNAGRRHGGLDGRATGGRRLRRPVRGAAGRSLTRGPPTDAVRLGCDPLDWGDGRRPAGTAPRGTGQRALRDEGRGRRHHRRQAALRVRPGGTGSWTASIGTAASAASSTPAASVSGRLGHAWLRSPLCRRREPWRLGDLPGGLGRDRHQHRGAGGAVPLGRRERPWGVLRRLFRRRRPRFAAGRVPRRPRDSLCPRSRPDRRHSRRAGGPRVRDERVVGRPRAGHVQGGRAVDEQRERHLPADDDNARWVGLLGRAAAHHAGRQGRHRDRDPRAVPERGGHDRELPAVGSSSPTARRRRRPACRPATRPARACSSLGRHSASSSAAPVRPLRPRAATTRTQGRPAAATLSSGSRPGRRAARVLTTRSSATRRCACRRATSTRPSGTLRSRAIRPATTTPRSAPRHRAPTPRATTTPLSARRRSRPARRASATRRSA